MRRLAALVLSFVLSAVAVVLVGPAGARAEGIITSLSVAPSMVRDGASVQGTVTLLPDGAPTTVLLFSSDPSVAAVPASVIAPAGQSTVTFTITTNAAALPEIVQIRAAVQNVLRTANLSVNAATPPGPALSSVSVTPATLTGGSAATGTLSFSGATDGAVVQLSSSNPAVAQVPDNAVVNGGAASGAFPVSTTAVTAPTTVTVTANWFAVTRTTTITVTPGAQAPADQVRITKAKWKARLLTIEATGTNPNAILSVFGPSGGFMFTLTNQGGGRYSDQRGWLDNPQVITVRSNFGGSATASVTS